MLHYDRRLNTIYQLPQKSSDMKCWYSYHLILTFSKKIYIYRTNCFIRYHLSHPVLYVLKLLSPVLCKLVAPRDF